MIALPPFIDPEAWHGFLEMRKSMKKIPFTDRAQKMILAELYKIKEAGHDPNAALDQSTLNGWRDVWAPRNKEIPRAAVTAPNKVLEVMQAEKQALQDPETKAKADAARREAMSKIRPIRRAA